MCTIYGFQFPGGWLWPTLILLGLAAAVLLFRLLRSGRRPDFRRGAVADRDDALRILRLRLAEGAITADEFERLRRAVDPRQPTGTDRQFLLSL